MKGFKGVLGIISLFAIISVFQVAGAADVAWMNPSGGLWNDGANWSTGTVPTASDNVYINYTATYNVALNSNPTVASLTIGGYGSTPTLMSNSWTITVNGTVTVLEGGAIDFTSASIDGGGTYILNNSGAITLNNSTIHHKVNNSGTIVIERTCYFEQSFANAAAGQLTLQGTSEGTAELYVDTIFTNSGTIDLTSTWPVTATTAQLKVTKGYLVNASGGTINALLGSSFNNTSTRGIHAMLNNQGTIRATGASMYIYQLTGAHSNSGSIIAEGGSVSFTQTGNNVPLNNTGLIQIYSGQTFSFGTADFNWISGDIQNYGTLSFTSVTADFAPQFTNNGTLTVGGAGSIVTLNDTLFNDGTINIAASSIEGPAPIVNDGTISFNTGTIDADVYNAGLIQATISGLINGALTTTTNSVIKSISTSTNNTYLSVDAGFTNNGTIELTQNAAGYIPYLSIIDTDDSLINAEGAYINATTGTGMAGTRYLNVRLRNAGTVNVSGGNLYLNLGYATHVNTGTYNLTGGDFTVPENFVDSGTITIGDGWMFLSSGGTFSYYYNGTISGGGILRCLNNDVDFASSFTVPSTGPQLQLYGCTVTNSGNLVNQGTLTTSGSTFSGSGGIVNSATMTSTTCTYNQALTNIAKLTFYLTNTAAGIFGNYVGDTTWVVGTSTGSATLNVTNGFSNGGCIILTATDYDDTSHTATLNCASGQLSNGPQATILADLGGSTGGSRHLNASLSNSGTIGTNNIRMVIDAPSSDHVNYGLINLDGGPIYITQSGTSPTFINRGTINLADLQTLTFFGGDANNDPQGEITGTGSLNVYATTWNNSGTISPGNSAGRIILMANFLNADNTSKINFELGGLTPITEHDQLYITQTANLDGTLNISLLDGYTPEVNDSFLVMPYTTRMNDFDTVNGLTIGGIVFDTNFTATGLYIVTKSVTVNNPPVISGLPDSISFYVDSTEVLSLFDYVSDVESEDTALTYAFYVGNDSLEYAFDSTTGDLTLSATAGYVGEAGLLISVTDPGSAEARDTIIVTVMTLPNTPPVWTGLPDSLTFRVDSTATVNMWDYAADAESDDSLLAFSFSPENDSINTSYFLSTGNVVISADAGYAGISLLIITVEDPELESAVDTIVLTVTEIPNEPPVISLPDSADFRVDSTLTWDIFSLVDDPDADDTLLYYAFSASNDSLERDFDNMTGILTLSATAGFSGEALLILVVTDPDTTIVSDTTVVTVRPIPNTAPTLVGLPDSLTFTDDTSAVVGLWDYAGDFETEDSLLNYAFAVSNDSLLYSFESTTGVLTLTSEPGFSGDVSLEVEVSDPQGAIALDTIIVTVEFVLGIDGTRNGSLPNSFALWQNYPNPFNPATVIEYDVPTSTRVNLTVYNLQGQKICTLVDQMKTAGAYQIVWDGTNGSGHSVATGVYFYKMTAGSFVETKKMLLLK